MACALTFSATSFATPQIIAVDQIEDLNSITEIDGLSAQEVADVKTAMQQAQALQSFRDPGEPKQIYEGTISLDQIDQTAFKPADGTTTTTSSDLISFMRPAVTDIDQHPGRVSIEAHVGDDDVSYANGIYHLSTAENQDWTLKYDFINDSAAGEAPNTTNTSALSFFDFYEFNSPTEPNFNDLKYFIFEPKVNVITQNHFVAVSNSGDSKNNIGLSLTNKRKNITFKQETMFVSDFSFYGNDASQGNTTGDVSIATGVYNAFGATQGYATLHNDDIYFDENSEVIGSLFNVDERGNLVDEDGSVLTELGEALGKITFESFATIGITEKYRNQANNDYSGAVFGVFNNEGGTTVFEDGADIVVKAKDSNRVISAVTSSATQGVLDPLKQGTIEIQASESGRVSRIWGVAVDDIEKDNILFVEDNETVTEGTPGDDVAGEKPSLISEENWQERWDQYIQNLEDAENITLENAVLSLHGSEVNITDEGKQGSFDIRGDIVASTLNSSDANSNNAKNDDPHAVNETGYSVAGTVIHSDVTIDLTNRNSVLYGNVYERHRVGKEEAVTFVTNNDLYQKEDGGTTVNSTFEAWRDYQETLEQQSLGGNVQLSLSNGATWYLQKNWKGWNNDLNYDKFNTTVAGLEEIPTTINYGEDGQVTIEGDATKTDNIYEKIDFSDQYNLHVFKEGEGYVKVNDGYFDEDGFQNKYDDANKVNDLDILQEDQISYAYDKAGEYTTVDNGIYHLTLNHGGVVDTRYMRTDFAFDSVDAINSGIGEFDNGIKKLRVQELDGTGGTFSIYAKDDDNHDLIIIDGIKDSATKAENNVSINFDIWNQDAGDLGIIANDASTFVQIGRIAKDISFNEQIVVGPAIGNILQYTYDVKADDEKWTWTTEQQLDYHEQMQNVFIVNSRSEVDPGIVEGVRLSSSMAYNYAVMDIDRLQKRRGEARYIDQQNDGLWARYRHLNSGLSGYDNQADVVQIGYDHKVRNDESYNVYSIAFDYLHGESDFSNGDGELDRYSLGLYDTWLLDNGSYLDLSAKVGWFDADTDLGFNTAKGQYYDLSGDYDFWGASIGAEIGRKYANEDQWFFEPQTQLTYTYIGDFDYDTPNQVKVESDNVDSLIMRLGFRVGKDFGKSVEDGLYSIYLMGDALHEFLGDQELTVTGGDASEKLKFDGDRTWYDVGVGVSCTLGESSYMFINYERALGSDMDNTWEVSAGLSYVF